MNTISGAHHDASSPRFGPVLGHCIVGLSSSPAVRPRRNQIASAWLAHVDHRIQSVGQPMVCHLTLCGAVPHQMPQAPLAKLVAGRVAPSHNGKEPSGQGWQSCPLPFGARSSAVTGVVVSRFGQPREMLANGEQAERQRPCQARLRGNCRAFMPMLSGGVPVILT